MIGLEDDIENPPENVIGIKRTENQVELAEYYSLADIFLICSKRENFPTTCLESLSCGTPIIGFDEGGTAETAPNNYGYFVPYGDLNSLESLVQVFYDEKSTFKSPAECRDFAVSNYSKEQMYLKYLNVYQKINDKG